MRDLPVSTRSTHDRTQADSAPTAHATPTVTGLPRSTTPVANTLPQNQPEGIDDFRDADYEPMEVDASQPLYGSGGEGLIRPLELQPLQIGIDPIHHCIVCEGCQCGVPRLSLHNHIAQSHGGISKAPANLESILDQHQVPIEIHPPTSKVIPIASLPITPGYMCTIPGCGAAGEVHASFTRNHSRLAHPDIPASKRIVPSLIQVVFPARNEYQAWPVDPNYATLPASIDYVSALDRTKQHDAYGWDDGTVQTPRDPRHINGFLKEFGWLRITEGRNYEELCSLVEIPSRQNPALLPLKDNLEGYFDGIRPIVEGMAPLVLRWVNTPEG